MTLPFWKMHGAGNDFVIVDDREGTFPNSDIPWLKRTAARHTGVGCDGFILLQNSDSADARMRIINRDGSEAEMCGNGARCAARLAAEMGITDQTMTLETGAGLLRAHVMDGGERVRLEMCEAVDWRMDLKLVNVLWAGERVRARGRLAEESQEGTRRRRQLDVWVEKCDEAATPVVVGTASALV